MIWKLFLLLTLTPLLELAILIRAAGALLARGQGLRVIREFQRSLSQGRLPADPMLDGLLVVAGGALLLTPGLLTDAVGFSLVFPPTRAWWRVYAKAKLLNSLASGAVTFTRFQRHPRGASRRAPDRDDVIDV
ncbi:MAG: FxsA family protein [Nitrospinae bacterium]|nr:FxsA family protein [Nitrospinota bacterium]